MQASDRGDDDDSPDLPGDSDEFAFERLLNPVDKVEKGTTAAAFEGTISKPHGTLVFSHVDALATDGRAVAAPLSLDWLAPVATAAVSPHAVHLCPGGPGLLLQFYTIYDPLAYKRRVALRSQCLLSPFLLNAVGVPQLALTLQALKALPDASPLSDAQLSDIVSASHHVARLVARVCPELIINDLVSTVAVWLWGAEVTPCLSQHMAAFAPPPVDATASAHVAAACLTPLFMQFQDGHIEVHPAAPRFSPSSSSSSPSPPFALELTLAPVAKLSVLCLGSTPAISMSCRAQHVVWTARARGLPWTPNTLRALSGLSGASWRSSAAELSAAVKSCIASPHGNTPMVVVCVGVPGSGKSTVCQRLVASSSPSWPWAHVCQDLLHTRRIAQAEMLRQLLCGVNVLVDRCNAEASHRSAWIQAARKVGVHRFVALVFEVPVGECKRRVSVRHDHPTLRPEKGNEAINDIHGRMTRVTLAEGFEEIVVVSNDKQIDQFVARFGRPGANRAGK